MNFAKTKMLGLMIVGLAISQVVQAQSAMYVNELGDVGIGTDTPLGKLHVKDGDLIVEQTTPDTHALLTFATAASAWEIKQNGVTGRLTFFSPGGGATTASFKFAPQAQENLFRVGILAGDTVDINGKLVINGVDVTPDFVFEPDYALESIEEHAKSMWENKHLPAMTSAAVNESDGVDIVKHQFGVLEELEKAHIFIAQLNEELNALRAEVTELKQQQ